VAITKPGVFLIVFQGGGQSTRFDGYDGEGYSQFSAGAGGSITIAHKRLREGQSVSFTQDVITFPDGGTMGQSNSVQGIAPEPFGGEIMIRGADGGGGLCAAYSPVFPSVGSGGSSFFNGYDNVATSAAAARLTIIKTAD
jgi:hypothetical protein